MDMHQEIHQEQPNVLVIGLGNEFRCDDAAGLVIARKLAAAGLQAIAVLEESGDCTRLVETWSIAPSVILLDAVSSGIEPGTMLAFDLLRDEIPARYFQHSLHAFGVLEAVRLARNLGTLPNRLKLFGIEGERFEPGVGLSPVVAHGIDMALPRIIRECEKLAGAHLPACSS